MTPDEAYAVLAANLATHDDDILKQAWRALDGALSTGADLPYQWERLTASAAAERAGKSSQGTFQSLVNQGYAPPPDGRDSAGRAFWLKTTIDAFLAGGWRPTPRQRRPDEPPHSNGRTADWLEWATARGVRVTRHTRRVEIIAKCRTAGLL